MKKGISIWSFAEPDLKKCFLLAKDAGFDGVEVALDTAGIINLDCTKEDMEQVKSWAQEAGIALYSVASGLYWKQNCTSNDPQTRSNAIAITKKQLQVASWLGCQSILVVPGAVGVDFEPGSEVVEYDVAYERCLAALKELAPVLPPAHLVPELKKMGKKLYIISNYGIETFAATQAQFPELFSQFDGMVISAREKLIKPDLRIYQLLCDRYGLKPEECVFIDDLYANVQGAIDAGFQGIHYTGPEAIA